MKCTYHMRTDRIADEDGIEFTVYGIEAVDSAGNIVRSIPDVFFDPKRAKNFADRCNLFNLSPIHLMDVIEDAMIESECVRH